ncbi:hypothetical protein IWQ60_005361 [Tieghemiomyces parasiticus]|uniref:Uncharacterized protein n=1 Tax=Tieghemiomyces parasiticus TaxID=78921 RepID=A0A9W8ACI3_9FUNG|nr:hypothetical protein IWQ60_005361 [Tieghemiomyces parasiticus]
MHPPTDRYRRNPPGRDADRSYGPGDSPNAPRRSGPSRRHARSDGSGPDLADHASTPPYRNPSRPRVEYQTAPPSTAVPSGPFAPPSRTTTARSHVSVLRKHNEEAALRQEAQQLLSQARATTPGTYVAHLSRNNNLLVPVLPRLPRPGA